MTFLPAAIVIALTCASAAIYLAIKQAQAVRVAKEKEIKQKQRLYELTVIKEIQDRISYSLDVEKVIDVITGSLRNLFPFTAASSIVVKDEKIIFKILLEESVNPAFIEQVKKTLRGSLEALVEKPLPGTIEEHTSGMMVDEAITTPLGSFFNIPLIVNNEVLGIINVSSTKSNLYKEGEMTILYQITNQASSALSKLQQVLLTEKDKLISMIRSIVDGVFMVDMNNQLLVINDAARSMLALDKENPTTIDVYSALENHYKIIENIKNSIDQKKNVFEKEVVLGGEKTVQVFITPVSDTQTGNIIGASVLLHDITLEKSITRMREDFTNMMVHELRAPLTAIRGASQLMITNAEKLDKDELAKLLYIIHKQTVRMINEVSLLLDAAKIDAGKFSLEKSEGDLGKIIEETVLIFTPQAQEKNISLTHTIDPSLPKISIDQQRIGQVINNLLSNSLKFTEIGGAISISAKRENDSVAVSVSDNGIGIPKETQGKLFSRFFQVTYPHLTGTETKIHLGTGLGLFFVKGVVQAHGGRVSLQSEPGHGTTITFTLPTTSSHPS